jgi:hypothetical protein
MKLFLSIKYISAECRDTHDCDGWKQFLIDLFDNFVAIAGVLSNNVLQ